MEINKGITPEKDWSDLKAFEHVGERFGDPYITISARKTMTLTSGFLHHAINQIKVMTHVILSYSEINNAIVLLFTKDSKAKGAIKMTIRGDNAGKGNASIAARSFFNYHKIDVKSCEGKHMAQYENIPNRGESWVIYL